jgi:hypothetical protein
MPRLVAEAFAEPLQEPAHLTPDDRYDEALALSVLPDGRVFVEHASAPETQTVTKTIGQQDDRHETRPSPRLTPSETDTWRTVMQGTHTAVEAEADDWASTRKGTETITFVDAEGDDWTALPQLDTHTRVRNEADDWAA